jgi:hypothetical protein
MRNATEEAAEETEKATEKMELATEQAELLGDSFTELRRAAESGVPGAARALDQLISKLEQANEAAASLNSSIEALTDQAG